MSSVGNGGPVTESTRVSRRNLLLGVGGAAVIGVAGGGLGYALGHQDTDKTDKTDKSVGATEAAQAGPPKYRSRPDLRTLPDVTITTAAVVRFLTASFSGSSHTRME